MKRSNIWMKRNHLSSNAITQNESKKKEMKRIYISIYEWYELQCNDVKGYKQ